MAGKNFYITSEICVKIATALLKLANLPECRLGFPEGKRLKSYSVRNSSEE
jgi:hypothetical protein